MVGGAKRERGTYAESWGYLTGGSPGQPPAMVEVAGSKYGEEPHVTLSWPCGQL